MNKNDTDRVLKDNRTHVPVQEMPYDSGINRDWHRHGCRKCGIQWAHDGKVERPAFIHDAAHVCPVCGDWALECL